MTPGGFAAAPPDGPALGRVPACGCGEYPNRIGRERCGSCVTASYGLVASAILLRNPSAEVIAFDDQVRPLVLNPRDSVTTNAEILARTGGGGTNTSQPLAWLNARQARGDLVVYCSDNKSWMDSHQAAASETLRQWEAFRARNPAARLVCLDLQPYTSSQVVSRADILNIGGFSDTLFEVLGRFARGEHDGEHWVAAIEAVEL